MYILSFFTSEGIPATGLSPKVKIIEVPSGTVTVSAGEMSELSNGFYYYNFTDYSYTKDYAIICDGTDVLPVSERYVIAGNENYREDINNVMTSNELLQRAVGLLHENIYIDSPTYDDNNNLVGARVKIYSNAESVGTGDDIIGEYLISSSGNGPGKFTTWSQIKL